MTRKDYLIDPSLEATATVTAILTGERLIVRLSNTLFHPQGGGQKADRGFIGRAQVLHVAHNEGDVDHYVDKVDGLGIGESYQISIDAEWRRLNAAYHTAGHLIASLIEYRYPKLHAVSGHQWPGEGRVEFDGDFDGLDEIKTSLEGDASDALTSQFPVSIIGDPFTDRSIQIKDFAPIPCGGTHVTNIADIGNILIDGIKMKNGRLRISYTIVLK